MKGTTIPVEELRAVDRHLLEAIRRIAAGEAEGVGVEQLIEALGVTATAVRQRIERLLQSRLIAREKVVHGRGRPVFRYHLTVEGYRRCGAESTDIAEAMWREILAIDDREARDRVLAGIAVRLGRRYAAELAEGGAEASGSAPLEQRLEQLSQLLTARHISAEVSNSEALPVLDICACPYPSLTDASDDRAMCHLEEQMISEALGRPVQLSRCCLDGDTRCQFTTVPSG